ncbi:MAG TPA: ArsR family transcriptional regulator [Ktedonobacteraceae bacterium]|jgi:protein-tyrosine-phosphatase/DNA-binding MarR family transcriptional regulator
MDGMLIPPPEVLKLAGHPIRWSVLTRLARSDYRVQELVAFLQLPQNLVSYHLRQLRAGNLVTERKSSADERSVYYSLDLEQFRMLYVQAGSHLHPALAHGLSEPSVANHLGKADAPPLRVLFLCTENSARSQMAEALLRHLSHGTIEAKSAGSRPAERVHPLAVQVMGHRGFDMSQAHPKHFDEFLGQHFDAIVTVCDRVREVCPVFPDDPERIHWSFSDPAQVAGSEEERLHAFEQISLQLTTRIRLLITLLAREHRR